MEAALFLPLTLTERLSYPEELRVTAPWDEFLELLPDCAYRIEYDRGQIISYMGYATENHEDLVLRIAEILRKALGEDQFSYRGSNLALHVPGDSKHYFNADCTVIQGESEKVSLRGNMYAIANPVLLVEVLSKSTANYDLGIKFKQYRKIPSLQQVLFIDSEEINVISQSRIEGSSDWLLQEYTGTDDEIALLGQSSFRVLELYAKMKLR